MRQISLFMLPLLSFFALLAPAEAAQTVLTQPVLVQANQSNPAIQASTNRNAQLDALFAELKREPNPQKANRISQQIARQWRDSGSATANILMQWADDAIAKGKTSLALDFLDQVIVLMPDFAEGWNKRATLNYAMGNYGKAMADIDHVLALEPRHFGAIAGMASILETTGNDKLELRAWEQLLAIYPANPKAQKKLGELIEKLEGKKI